MRQLVGQLFPPLSRYLFNIHFVLGSIEATGETQHSHAFEVFISSLHDVSSVQTQATVGSSFSKHVSGVCAMMSDYLVSS